MKENIVPILTEVGKIWGRDAIFLHSVYIINAKAFQLTGEFSSNNCSNLRDTHDRKYQITFWGVRLFKMIELDFDEIEYQSSFDLIENSKQLLRMINEDKASGIGKIDATYKHYVFRTYDTVFEIIGKDFELLLK